jgi:hypothetical protein
MKSRRRNLLERQTVRRSFTELAQVPGKGEKLDWSPESHILSNFCMLSPNSRNGRTYTPEAMEQLVEMYEGAKAYQDHPEDPAGPRSTKERIGRWQNIRLENGKIRGDLHYDPNHPYAKSLIWAAQNCPEHCGVSHNIEAEGYEDEDGHFTVTRPTEVRSADIVDDPATNKSLLESHKPRRRRSGVPNGTPQRRRKVREGAMDPELDDGMTGMDDMDDGAESPEQMLGKYVTACFHDKSMTKEQKMEKLKTVFGKLLDDAEAGGDDMEEEDEDVVDKDPEDERRRPAAQEPEDEDQFEEEEDEEDPEDTPANRAAFDKAADWMKSRPEGPKKAAEARESLQRLRKHKDKRIRAVVEIALRAIPKPPRPVRRQVATESLGHHSDPAVRTMAKRLDALEAEKSVVASVQRALQECKAAGLPKRVMTRLFIEDLAECADPRRRKAMIRERAHLASVNLPRSFGPGGVGGGPPRVSDADFAAMVNGAD